MAVTEVLRGLGKWQVSLKASTPKSLLDDLEYFGHIAIASGRVDPRMLGDEMLTSSRYIGVYRHRAEGGNEQTVLSGSGMAMWLGDEDHKSDVIENTITLRDVSFADTIRQLLPASGSVIEGTIFNLAETFTGFFQFMSPREAINYATDTMNADWIVRGDGTLDAGREADLFRTTPEAIIARKQAGQDMFLQGFLGNIDTERDVEDFTTRVVLLTQDELGTILTGDADIAPDKNPYKDLHGNTLKMTRMVSESQTDFTNAQARAQLQLNRFSGTRDAIKLSTSEYEFEGTAEVGDYVWVYDPDIGLVDHANEVRFRGSVIYPLKLRLREMTWPLKNNMTVAYRDWNGNWVDLTDYVIFETGETNVVVGGFHRALSDAADGGSQAGSFPVQNNTVPAAPTWNEPFNLSVYQSPHTGETRAQVILEWNKPNNTDGTTISDGDHYEIRYRPSDKPIFPVTLSQMEQYTMDELETMPGATIEDPIAFNTFDWEYAYVSFDELEFTIQNLVPSKPYEAQIRGVDAASPANYGAWSATAFWQTSRDTIAPDTPAPPEVAASRIAIQVIHRLGVSTGGEFNLAPDLHHFEVHGASDEGFQPTAETLLGKIPATPAMLSARVPSVATIQIEDVIPVWFRVIAVDDSGNKSNPSVSVQQTVELIDNAHISDLTVSKVTAGTISADWFVGAKIKTGNTGARVELDPDGIKAFDSNGVETSSIRSADGKASFVGELASGVGGKRVVVNEEDLGLFVPEIRMYTGDGSTFSYMNAPTAASDGSATFGANSGKDSATGTRQTTLWLFHNTGKLAYTEVGTGSTKGGEVEVFDTGASIGYNNGSGTSPYIWVGSDNQIHFKGIFPNGNQVGSGAALFFYANNWNGGSITYDWGPTDGGATAVASMFHANAGYNSTINVMGFDHSDTQTSVGTGVNGPGGRYGLVIFRTTHST